MALRAEYRAAGIRYGPHGAARLLPSKRSAKAIDVGITVHVEWARATADGVLVEDDQNGRRGELGT